MYLPTGYLPTSYLPTGYLSESDVAPDQTQDEPVVAVVAACFPCVRVGTQVTCIRWKEVRGAWVPAITVCQIEEWDHGKVE
jgi:hypothetical protein